MSPRVCIVDNDASYGALLRDGLRDAGFDAVSFSDGLVALEGLCAGRFDVLVTDLVMPGLDGYGLLSALSAEPSGRDVFRVVLSAVAAEDREPANVPACDVYLAKDRFDRTISRLAQIVRDVDRYRSQDGGPHVMGLETVYPRGVTRELLEERRDLEGFLDVIPEVALRLSPDWRILRANGAGLRVLAQPSGSVFGASLREMMEPKHFDRLARALTEGETGFEVRFRDRLYICEALRLVEVPFRQIILLWRDITDQVIREQQFQTIVESTRTIICATDPSLRITYVSPAARTIAGYEPETLVGKHLGDLAIGHDPEFVRQWLDDAVETLSASAETLPNREIDIRAPRADGEMRTWRLRISPLQGRQAEIAGLRCSIYDVTERRQLEAERSRLAAANQELLRELHHRVKNNLQLIISIMRLQELRETDQDSVGGARRDVREVLHDTEQRLMAVAAVHDELYRRRHLDFIDLAELVPNLMRQFDEESSDGSATLRTTFTMQPLDVALEKAVPLAVIIYEITRNTVLHGYPQTGPNEQVVAEIHVGLSADDGWAVLTHRDFGRGIDPHQGHSSGLGIQVVQLLAEQIGGGAELVPADRGTLWTVRFPTRSEGYSPR